MKSVGVTSNPKDVATQEQVAARLPLSGGNMTGAINEAPLTTVAAAATCDLTATASNTISISNGPAITTFGAGVPGMRRRLIFQGAVTITYSAATLLLPGLANIVTAYGDSCEVVCTAASTWQIVDYTPYTGRALIPTPDSTKLPLAGGKMTGALDLATPPAGDPVMPTADSNNFLSYGVAANNTANAIRVAPNSNGLFGGVTGLTPGATRIIKFTGTMTLNTGGRWNLPSSGAITTANGDIMEIMMSYDTVNADIISYTRKDGSPIAGATDATKLPLAGGKMTGALNLAVPVTLASAATTDIGAQAANTINITGTTAITSLGTIAAGAKRTLIFSAALVLTYSATALILPGAANIATAAGDVAEFESLGGGNWKCTNYTRADGTAVVGSPGRNLIYNPLFNVNQRVYTSGAATTAANQYTFDRWRVVTSGQAISLSGVVATFPAGGGGQIVEGADLLSGTYTLSWTGGGTAKINGAVVANGGQVSLTAGTNVDVVFVGQVSYPKLEFGSVKTSWEIRTFAEEELRCKRYLRVLRAVGGYDLFAVGWLPTASVARFIIYLDGMRSAPTVTATGNFLVSDSSGTIKPVSSITVATNSIQFVAFDITISGSAAGSGASLQANNSPGAFLMFSSEL